MSAMDVFRSRVAQSAKAAAGAARQLSALDDMAQNDDYVQSEGLRVSDKKQYSSSAASSVSDISGFSSTSVVEDLSGKFVDALSTAARKHHRPRLVNERNPLTPPDPNWQASPMAMAPSQNNTSKGGLRTSKPATQLGKSKSIPRQPKLVSSVAALYDQNNDKKRATIQPSKRNDSQKQPHVHQNIMQPVPNERGGYASKLKLNQSPGSLETISSSPGQNKNVLLVNERHAHILHELDYDSDAESSDEENLIESQINTSRDLEIGRVRNASLPEQLEQELEESISRQNSLNGPSNQNEEKDVNRFMNMTAGIESERESLLNAYESDPGPTLTNADRGEGPKVTWAPDVRRGTAGEETNKVFMAGLSWVRNVASPQLEAFSKQIMTKVSEADVKKSGTAAQPQRPGSRPMIGPRHTPTTNDVSEAENITMTSSSSFLADADMAELERIRMRNSSSKLRVLMQVCLDNPRLGFIAVTLVIAIFAYYYSRHRSVDDVL